MEALLLMPFIRRIAIIGTAMSRIMAMMTDMTVMMIFIHGGPASPMGYVSSYFQRELESKLTIINYDQRGSGRYMKIEIFSKLFI